ncbi:3-isopropylmalate dehydratase large subunit [Pseudoduganella namucuonensis]|uniref:3-isopropylmalate dehydratase large subunit n=1 Tax=Pseudoduganella namucuonensis TaxID=1035707 RepID=A0A1I7LE12_9BURK|nr:3-isopropylmalate dehydratase large subunit [Pseudoduganella namucuonensis]SFV07921.1 3-isopropylmalate/(R)-2-methylmalate dehydratase large subunit [Pseudoduganella namucuonensis]
MPSLFSKIWDRHVVAQKDDGATLLYIDRQLVHEVTSPQAFEGLREAGRPVRRPATLLAVPDHNVPTTPDRTLRIEDAQSREQIALLRHNARETGATLFDLDDARQGIVHVVAPEQGFIHPGMTVVCGDSHTATLGAFGAIAFGVGTSDVEHVLATQTLWLAKPRQMRVRVEGRLQPWVGAKDLILALIARIGAAGGTGHAIEYCGEAVRALSMEERMTVCNMTIEAGARFGLVAPDDTTFAYLRGRPYAPGAEHWQAALAEWRGLASDADAQYDAELVIDAAAIAPQVTWGTSPEDSLPIEGRVPDPAAAGSPALRERMRRALDYMGLAAGAALTDIAIDRVFIGSCTNSRIEDLRVAASVARGRRVAPGVAAMVVPGSGLVKLQAEREGLDRVFIEAGFAWTLPGCSMCLGMNPDRLLPGERCASTSNRNFEGRQGPGGRTHLLSPAMAVAAAVTGRLCDVRALEAA